MAAGDAIIRGESWELSFGPETSYGVDPGTAALNWVFGVVQQATMPDPEFNWMPYWMLGSASKRNFYIMYRGRKSFAGSIPDIVLINGYPLYLPIGDVVTTGTESPYTHTISETNRLKSITMQHELFDADGNSELIRRWSGGKVNRASYHASEGEPLMMSIEEIIFNSYASSGDSGIASASASYPTTDPYLFCHGALTLFGTEFARVRNFSIEVSNNIEPKYYITDDSAESRAPYELREGRREYRMTANIDIADSSIFDALVAEGVYTSLKGFDISLVFTRGDNDTITFTIPPTTADAGGDSQGAFIRSAPHNIVNEPAVSVPVDIIFRSMKIVVVDAVEDYPED